MEWLAVGAVGLYNHRSTQVSHKTFIHAGVIAPHCLMPMLYSTGDGLQQCSRTPPSSPVLLVMTLPASKDGNANPLVYPQP